MQKVGLAENFVKCELNNLKLSKCVYTLKVKFIGNSIYSCLFTIKR